MSEKQVASTATIKFDKGYDAPWYVAYGSPEEIKAELIDAFGLDGASDAGLTTAEVIVEASRVARNLWTASSKLGGQIIGIEDNRQPIPATNPMTATSPTGEAAWDAAESAGAGKDDPPFEPNVDPLISRIRTVATKAEFALLWKANTARFAEPEIKAEAAIAQKRLAA
ncbi:hypothetical protein [Cellulomonas sp. SG140]|uniref:hypothetical protein n=1 Tax=Cellulomonas sp. SG140 TaxID=2976536 RepID=UPI0021E84EE8|nr:hypothetical protein [Cellulomonas sp. SG140]